MTRNPNYDIKGGVNFSYVTADAFITSENGVPSFDEDARSYNIKKNRRNGDYIVYEVFRKGKKPIRRGTIKSSKKKHKLTIPEAIAKFKSKKPRFSYKTTYKGSDADFVVVKTYQNTKPTKQQMRTGKVQLQILAYVEMIKKPNINGTYVGYSGAVYYNQVDGDLSGLYDDALASARKAFFVNHPRVKTGSDNLNIEVLQKRWIRWQDKPKRGRDVQ